MPVLVGIAGGLLVGGWLTANEYFQNQHPLRAHFHIVRRGHVAPPRPPAYLERLSGRYVRGLVHGEVLTVDPSGRFEIAILLPQGGVQEPIIKGQYHVERDALVLTAATGQVRTTEMLPPKRLSALQWEGNQYLLSGGEMVSFPRAVEKRWVRKHHLAGIFYQRVGDERTRIEGVPDYRAR